MGPAAIAAGLTEDIAPLPKRSVEGSSPAAASSSSPQAGDSAEDRWKKAKSQCVGQWENAKADIIAQKTKEETDRFKKVDEKAKRAANQPQRGCPVFSQEAEALLKTSPPAISPPTCPPEASAVHRPPRACPTFSPSHLNDMPDPPKASARQQRSSSSSSSLLLEDLIVGGGPVDPSQPALLEQLRRKLGCSASKVVAIEAMNDYRGGLNEGVWFLG